jgi:hypothetical protein
LHNLLSSGEDRTRTDFHNPLQDNELGNPADASAAAGAAIEGNSALIDPDLAAVVNAWPTLPETIRRQIAATIREAVGSHGVGDGGAR